MKWFSSFGIRPALLATSLPLAVAAVWCTPHTIVDEEEHNYGVVYEETQDVVSHTYTIVNGGTSTLVIKDIKPSCGCTKAEISREEIPPGESAELTAELKVEARQGRKRIRVTVYTNDPDRDRVELGLSGDVIRRWYVHPTYIDAGVILTSQVATRRIRFTCQRLPGEPLPEIVSANSDNPSISVRLQKSPEVVDKTIYRERTTQALIEIAAGDSMVNDIRGQIVFHTNDPAQPTFTIPLRWMVEKDLSLGPRSLNLVRSRYQLDGPETMAEKFSSGRPLARDSGKVVVASRSSSPFRILDATAPEPFDVYWGEEGTPAHGTILVSLKPAPPGTYSGNLSVTTDRPDEPTLTATLTGEVQQQAPFLTTSSMLGHFSPVFADEVPEVSKTFRLRNSGSLPLNLVLQKSSGGEARLSEGKLEPNATTTLTVLADLRGKKGMVEVLADVRTNDPLSPVKTFSLRGRVLPRWEVEPETVHFRNVRNGQEEMRRALIRQFFPSWELPVGISTSQSEGGAIRIEPGSSRTTHGKLGYSTAETELTVRLRPSGPVGPNENEAVVHTADDRGGTLPRIKVTWSVMGNLAVRPRKLILEDLPGIDESGKIEPKRVRIYSRDKAPFTVTGLDLVDGIEAVEAEREDWKAVYEIRVVDRDRLMAAKETALVFRTNLPEEPNAVLPIVRSEAGSD